MTSIIVIPFERDLPSSPSAGVVSCTCAFLAPPRFARPAFVVAFGATDTGVGTIAFVVTIGDASGAALVTCVRSETIEADRGRFAGTLVIKQD